MLDIAQLSFCTQPRHSALRASRAASRSLWRSVLLGNELELQLVEGKLLLAYAMCERERSRRHSLAGSLARERTNVLEGIFATNAIRAHLFAYLGDILARNSESAAGQSINQSINQHSYLSPPTYC